VDQSARVQRLGEHLLLDALHRSLTHADEIAAMAVVVDAKDENAASFYRHYGFIPLQAQPRRLYVPMRVVAQLLG
jgi:predicted GNAT family N-acyltransferase